MSTTLQPDQETLQYPAGRNVLLAEPTVAQMAGWIDEIEQLPARMRAALAGLSDAQLDTPYRPGGWTVRQVAHHVPDSHMNAYLRTKWILTEDRPTIKPYNQDDWSALPFARTGPAGLSLDALAAVHALWVPVLRSVTPEQWRREYFHPEDQRYFALSDLLQTYAWHSRHHLAHVTSLRQRMSW